MHWELVPTGMHQINVAERHFKSILCGVATNFPLNKWDTLLPQSKQTCNLLHQSNIAPNVSAQAYTFRPHDLTVCPWHHWDVRCKSTKKRTNSKHGQYIQLMDSISEPRQNIIDVLTYGSKKQER